MALFEAAASISAAVAALPLALGAAKAWLATRRKHSDSQIKVTLSDGDELTITTSNMDTGKILEFLAKVQADEQALQEGNLPSGEDE